MSARSGYTLPVFACAAALAALKWLYDRHAPEIRHKKVSINLLQPPEIVPIAIDQVAGLQPNLALAISRSDPGDNLDLTRDTPIWALVRLNPDGQTETLVVEGGEGVGRILDSASPDQNSPEKAAIYSYARALLNVNLTPFLAPCDRLHVTIILPEGRALAERTSNAAFGVVEGLSLLGTTGIAQPLSSPAQLETFRRQLRQKASRFSTLVFCLGENGLDLATQVGIPPEQQLKTANWLGPLLVEAGLLQVPSILLFGYHGKLIKLAGGIFQTHHHVADGRLEILTAQAASVGISLPLLQQIFTSETVEAALNSLRAVDSSQNTDWVDRVYASIAETLDCRAQAYVKTHSGATVQIGSVLFDRRRQIICASTIGATLLNLVKTKTS